MIPITPFPLDIFPIGFQNTVKKEGISLGVGHEVIANAKLAILSGAIGNSIRISPKSGYEVAPFIWLGIVAKSGFGKSPAINSLMHTVEDRQAKSYRIYRVEMDKYVDKQSKIKPVFKQYKVSDTTVEALADVFESQPRGVILHRDELSALILSLNQYKKSKGSDKQHYIELFDCKPIIINRKTTGFKYIHSTGAAIIGGITPHSLPNILDVGSIHDGFLPRFLFLHIDVKPIKYCRKNLDHKYKCYWKSLVEFCYKIPLKFDENDCVKPNILTLDAKALDLWESFYNEYNEKTLFGLGIISCFLPKLITYSLKFACILHIIKSFMRGTIDNEVDVDTINGAIKLTRFYAGQSVELVKLYDLHEEKFDDRQKGIIEVLYNLKGKVKGGELPLSEIVDNYNDSLPVNLMLSNEKISSILNNGLGLGTEKTGGNLSHLVWEEEKIQKLFKLTITSVPSVTKSKRY